MRNGCDNRIIVERKRVWARNEENNSSDHYYYHINVKKSVFFIYKCPLQYLVIARGNLNEPYRIPIFRSNEHAEKPQYVFRSGWQFNYDLYVIIIGIYKDLLVCILVIKPGSRRISLLLLLLTLMFIASEPTRNGPHIPYVL